MSNQKYLAVSEVLKAAQSQINALLSHPDDELHRLQINQVLQQQGDRILLITGTGDLSKQQTTTLGPAKTIGGKPIGKVRRFAESDLIPADDKVFKLKQDIEDALIYFGPDASSEGILANIPELIIRGVAKKAGLHVTRDEPKELTVEFIDQIRAALHPEGDNASDKILPKVGVGGVSEVLELSPEDVGPPLGQGVIENPTPEVTQATDDFAKQIMETGKIPVGNVGLPNIPEQDNVAEKPAEQPKVEEPKQDTKPDAKKKSAGK